jgi:hypothetical protein
LRWVFERNGRIVLAAMVSARGRAKVRFELAAAETRLANTAEIHLDGIHRLAVNRLSRACSAGWATRRVASLKSVLDRPA